MGDTFRWKGENVATAEVTAAVSDIPGVQDACVFGVEVPGADGKVGMACVELNDKSDGRCVSLCVEKIFVLFFSFCFWDCSM